MLIHTILKKYKFLSSIKNNQNLPSYSNFLSDANVSAYSKGQKTYKIIFASDDTNIFRSGIRDE
jgi:hypothetical protein